MNEPHRPTPEECLKALRDLLDAFACTKLETQTQCDAYEQGCLVANKLWKRELWESISKWPRKVHSNV